ncbi:ribonuclease H-like domain-containing protein [Diplogelasinospora grovesii]|uniref:Ribonuclease H-like domain-containing protein n=1 Tax=Diplogelasinospora grovesii TaxID=303347 RepID=A0AAN6N651_9PEZI|nr:ribonuclease H-like domain-containing protein [Diplogelasinospora grovesii]
MASTIFGAPVPSSVITQLTRTGSPIDSPDSIAIATWRGRRFVSADVIAGKGARGRYSWIRDHGVFVTELVGESDATGQSYCDDASPEEAPYLQNSIRHLLGLGRSSDSPQEAPLARGPLVTPSLKAIVEDLALGFVITSNQPFSVFQNPFLRQLLSTLNPSIHRTIGWGRSSIRQRLADTFASKKKLVQQELTTSVSKIHLAFDLWTSLNRLAILDVSAHFIDSKSSIQQRLLALREQQGAYTGLNIALTLAEIASDWEIIDRIGCLVSDNASNNDVCGEEFFRRILPGFSVEDASDRCIRCYGHILNLVGRAFLYGEDFESFEQESQAYETMDRIDDDLRHWRKRGPVGKLHNLVRWVRSSPQRSEFFKATIKEAEDGSGISLSEQSTLELQLLLNNETR